MPWDGTKNSAKEMAGQLLQRDTVLTSPCDCFHVANSAKTTARLAYGWCFLIIDLYDLSTLGNNICLFRVCTEREHLWVHDGQRSHRLAP